MNILRVGDPHVRVSNLSESEKLMGFVAEFARTAKVDRIELLGDQFHNHAVVRLEVIQFWERWFDELSDLCEVVALEGNHDQSGDYAGGYSALSIYKKMNKENLFIIDKPTKLGAIGYFPYMHDANQFISAVNKMTSYGVKTIVCHQTFAGSRYESGIYAPDGISTDSISVLVDHIISGHIHSQQEFDRVDYPGTARWDSVADANQAKGVWLYKHDETGKVLSKEFFSTESVCSPIFQITFSEGDPVSPRIPENARVTLELVGTSAWIVQQKLNFKGKVMFKAKITDTLKLESRKTGTGFEDYLLNIYDNSLPAGATREGLLRLAKEIGIV